MHLHINYKEGPIVNHVTRIGRFQFELVPGYYIQELDLMPAETRSVISGNVI